MKINGIKVLIIATFICSFMLPSYYLQYDLFGFNLVSYIFLAISILMYILNIASEKKISNLEFFSILIIIAFCFFQKSISPLYLIELMVAYRFSKSLLNSEFKVGNKILCLSILFVGVYSLMYFGYNGRYLYTGLKEINQCGFALLMLFIIIRKYNKLAGNILLFLGLFTFSRNYLLSMVIFLTIEKIKDTRFFTKIYKFFNFRNLTICSIALLLVIASTFNIAYRNNKITEYQTGWNRYLNLFDYSNYFRFTVNTKLLDIYIKHPSYLLTGLTDEKFYDFSIDVSVAKKIPYRQIKPHNYFFSYLRIYGIFSIFIFIVLGNIMKVITNKNNVSILIVLFAYANILGIGFANYWLFLSIITMYVYRNNDKGGYKNG